jgi:hypothetical protein
VKRPELDERLRRLGWRILREGKKHRIWTDGYGSVAVRRHPEINELTARAVLMVAEGSTNEG